MRKSDWRLGPRDQGSAEQYIAREIRPDNALSQNTYDGVVNRLRGYKEALLSHGSSFRVFFHGPAQGYLSGLSFLLSKQEIASVLPGLVTESWMKGIGRRIV